LYEWTIFFLVGVVMSTAKTWEKSGGSRIGEPRGPKKCVGGELGPSGPIGVYAYACYTKNSYI